MFSKSKANPGQIDLLAIGTSLHGMSITSAIDVSKLFKAKVSSRETLLLDICIIQDALQDKSKANKRGSRVIW